MNRRNFLGLSGLLALVPFVGAKKALAKPRASSVGHPPCPGHSARPQSSVDDLVAEYKAWVEGDLDGHDRIVRAYKVCLGQNPEPHPLAYGTCSCVSKMPTQVQAQLDREIAQQRRLLDEGKQRMQGLLQRSEAWGQQGAPASRYKGTLPKWMTE